MSQEIWVLLWSKNQNCFHVEPASELCRKNVNKMVVNGVINDYHTVYIGSRESCDRAADMSRHLLDKRENQHV